MMKAHATVGMTVTFGRTRGEQTLGKIVKMNPKKAKVEILEDRGSKSKKGEVWGVPYSLMTPHSLVAAVNAENAPASTPVAKVTEFKREIRFNPFDSVTYHTMAAIHAVYGELEPEMLSCDGEASAAHVRRRRAKLTKQLQALQAVLGYPVTQEQCWEYEESRKASRIPS